jgi:hypothetical protein
LLAKSRCSDFEKQLTGFQFRRRNRRRPLAPVAVSRKKIETDLRLKGQGNTQVKGTGFIGSAMGCLIVRRKSRFMPP